MVPLNDNTKEQQQNNTQDIHPLRYLILFRFTVYAIAFGGLVLNKVQLSQLRSTNLLNKENTNRVIEVCLS